MKSIISREKKCIVCGRTEGLHLHHVMFGTNHKKIADRYGLTVYLCQAHHEGTNGVHGKNGHALDLRLKQLAQRKFTAIHGLEKWIEVFGRNYN